jgi:hypothetical protein
VRAAAETDQPAADQGADNRPAPAAHPTPPGPEQLAAADTGRGPDGCQPCVNPRSRDRQRRAPTRQPRRRDTLSIQGDSLPGHPPGTKRSGRSGTSGGSARSPDLAAGESGSNAPQPTPANRHPRTLAPLAPSTHQGDSGRAARRHPQLGTPAANPLLTPAAPREPSLAVLPRRTERPAHTTGNGQILDMSIMIRPRRARRSHAGPAGPQDNQAPDPLVHAGGQPR